MFRLAFWLFFSSLVACVQQVSATSSTVQATGPLGSQYRGTRKNVLVLVSAHKTDTWSEAITDGVETVFTSSPDTIGIWTEYMDAYRFTSSNSKRVLAGLYRRKYAGLKFDVVVTIGNPAVKFALQHRGDLYTRTPIVFSGLSTAQAGAALAAGAVTGVSEEFRYRQTLDAAFRLLPDTHKIIFISPEMKNRRVADLMLADYRPQAEVEIWHDADLAAILERASRVSPGSIILPLAEPGRSPQYSKPRDRFMDALSAASPVPVFSVWDVSLGHGILGGYLTPGHYQGVLAGRFALELMHGKSLAGVPPAEVRADRLTVERSVLKHFDIDPARLPETVRLNPSDTHSWRWLRQYLQQIALVFFFLAAISAILLYLLISRRKAEAALAESEARFRAVIEHLPMSMALRDLQGRFLLVNPTFAKRFNIDQHAVRGRLGHQIYGNAFAAVLREQDKEVIERDSAVEREHIFEDENSGVQTALLVVKFPVRDAQGAINAVGTCALDISERNRAMEALVKSELRFQSLYDNAPDIYFTLNRNGNIAAVNKYGAEYLGYEKQELENSSILDLTHPSDRPAVRETLARLQLGQKPDHERRFEFRLMRRDATDIWVNMRAHVVNDVLDKEPALWAICRDVSAAHQLSEELSYQASHDSLTGLVNRREFEQRLKRAVEHLHESHGQHVLCFLDLDRFKVINDTCGHVAGDELLRQLGEVLKQRLRTRDIVARVGGDEFAILMEHCPLPQACRIAEQVRADVEKHRFNWQQQAFSLGVSIGIAVIDINSGNAQDILKAADSACYRAKEQGRNRIHIYSRDSIEVARHDGEVRWITRLQQALDENRFELWYQPILPVGEPADGHRQPHFEMLLRLRDNDNTLIASEAFMPGAERFDLVGRIDRWMVRQALAWLAENPAWMDRYDACLIKLSGASISDHSFLDFMSGQLAHSTIPVHHICFEITEAVATANSVNAANFIAALKPRGCRFALTHMGAGVFSFSHLQHLEVDFLKIDGQIVRDLAHNPVNLAMLQAISQVGGITDRISIAEAVEDQPTLDQLIELGVDYAQGSYIGAANPLRGIVMPENVTDISSAREGGHD